MGSVEQSTNNQSTQIENGVAIGKTSAFFVCANVSNTKNKKAGRRGDAYLATDELNNEVLKKLISRMRYKCTGKVDGSGGYIKDVMIKVTNKETGEDSFIQKVTLCKKYDHKDDSKSPPAGYFQTSEKTVNGHAIGFVPINENESSDKWHIDCFAKNPDGKPNYKLIKVLTYDPIAKTTQIREMEIESLNGKSVEIIGTKIQGNPHNVGNLNDVNYHCVTLHGDFVIDTFPDLYQYVDINTNKQIDCKSGQTALDAVKNWFQTSREAKYMEGIVLHFADGTMYKLHRHHLGLMWKENKDDTFVIPSLMNFPQ